MWENIVNNWRTSGVGLITVLAGGVAIFYPDKTAFINQVAGFISLLSGAIFALIPKDSSVTGTALNPRAQIVGEPTPPPSPAAVEKIAVIEAKKP